MDHLPTTFLSRAAAMIRQAATLLLLSWVAGCGADVPETDVAESEPTSTDGVAISADGVAIHYDARGTGDPALVLVHGWTNPRAIWGEHPNTLSRTNRVVALDLAGHGVSGADRRDWTVDAFGDDVAAVVDQLALERVVLVGFSMGSGVVLEAAERLGDRVVGIVFVDTFQDLDALPGSDSPDEDDQFEASIRAVWGDTAFVRAFAFTPDAPDSLISLVTEMMPEEPYDHWFTVGRAFDEWVASELIPTLQRIEAPIAAINTAMPPTNVEAMQRYVPSFTVDTIAGVGHAGILLQRVEDFDAILLEIVERFVSAATETPETSGRDDLMSQADQDRRVDYIEFRTTDIEESKRFYSEIFGWEFTDYGPDYTSFTDGRMNGGFESAPAVAAGGPLVVLYSTNLEAIEAAVRENGGTIVRETFEFPGGRRFHFTDPSGNELAVWSDR